MRSPSEEPACSGHVGNGQTLTLYRYPLTIDFRAVPVPLLPMVTGGLSIVGSAGAYKHEFTTMLDFVVRHGIRVQTQKFPMTQKGITEAMQTLAAGKMRYRGIVEVQK